MRQLRHFGTIALLVLALTGPAIAEDAASVRITPSDESPDVGERITFSANGPHGSDATYNWAFEDGGTGSGWLVAYTFDEPGLYTVRLTATVETVNVTRTYTLYVGDNRTRPTAPSPSNLLQ